MNLKAEYIVIGTTGRMEDPRLELVYRLGKEKGMKFGDVAKTRVLEAIAAYDNCGIVEKAGVTNPRSPEEGNGAH